MKSGFHVGPSSLNISHLRSPNFGSVFAFYFMAVFYFFFLTFPLDNAGVGS